MLASRSPAICQCNTLLSPSRELQVLDSLEEGTNCPRHEYSQVQCSAKSLVIGAGIQRKHDQAAFGIADE